jgi:transposase
MTLLDTIPKVDQQGAERWVAKTGIDMTCFGPSACLPAWAGMALGNNASAGKQRYGCTGHGNQPLRTVLTQLAHTAARTKRTYLSALSHGMATRRGRKEAIVAVARAKVTRSHFKTWSLRYHHAMNREGTQRRRAMAWRGLTEQPWEAIRVHLPAPQPSPLGGRPRVEDRRCFEGLLWILWTGAQWSALPRQYGRPTTCWRRLKRWEESGVLLKRWRAFLAQLNDQQKLRWDACCVDGSFIPANKGGPKSARPSGARAQSGWFWSMARGLRWEQSLEAASPAEVTRLEQTLDTVAVGRPGKPGRPRKRPERLIADRGDDSHPLRARLARRGIEPIIPARSTHQRATHQDGRQLRR